MGWEVSKTREWKIYIVLFFAIPCLLYFPLKILPKKLFSIILKMLLTNIREDV